MVGHSIQRGKQLYNEIHLKTTAGKVAKIYGDVKRTGTAPGFRMNCVLRLLNVKDANA